MALTSSSIESLYSEEFLECYNSQAIGIEVLSQRFPRSILKKYEILQTEGKGGFRKKHHARV